MKFWQLVSLLRSHKGALESALQEPAWSTYYRWYEEFEALVASQDRTKLDAKVPEALVEHALTLAPLEVFRGDGRLFSKRREQDDTGLPILDAYKLYGGTAIEDVFERGSIEI